VKSKSLATTLIALCFNAAAGAVQIDEGFLESTLRPIEILVTEKALTLLQIQKLPFTQPTTPQIGLRAGESVWLRLPLESAATVKVPLIARYEFPWTDRAEFFVVRESGEVISSSLGGDTVKGPRTERLPLVRFELQPRERLTVYLKVTTVARAAAQINLYKRESLTPRVFAELLAQGAFIGVVCMLLIFHLNMYIATRDAMLRSYLSYIFTVSLFIPLRSGILPQFLFGEYAHLSDMVWVILVSATYFTGVSSARALLSLQSTDPRADRLLVVLQVLTLTPALFLLIGRREAFIAENIAALFVGPPLLLLGIMHVLQRRQHAVYFVVGFSVPIIAAIADNLVEAGVVPAFTGRNEMLPAAMLFEFLLFAQIIYRKLADSEIARVKDHERLTRFRSELAFASAIQKSLLPPLEQTFGRIDVRVGYRSEKAVGNDYFDILEAGETSIGVLLTDAGAGRASSLAAALDASAVRMAFRNSFAAGAEPDLVMQRMFSMLEPVTKSRPVAATYVMLNTESGFATGYLHMNPAPVIVRASGAREAIFSENEDIPRAQVFELQLQPGDTLVLATTGIARRINLVRDRLNPRERVDKMQQRPRLNAGRIKRRARDDMTLITLHYREGQN
jgi:hypothetical protein